MLDDRQLASRVFHFIAAPKRCIDLAKGLLEARSKLANDESGDYQEAAKQKPLFVWEPMEESCKLDSFNNFLKAMEWVDVFCPSKPKHGVRMRVWPCKLKLTDGSFS